MARAGAGPSPRARLLRAARRLGRPARRRRRCSRPFPRSSAGCRRRWRRGRRERYADARHGGSMALALLVRGSSRRSPVPRCRRVPHRRGRGAAGSRSTREWVTRAAPGYLPVRFDITEPRRRRRVDRHRRSRSRFFPHATAAGQAARSRASSACGWRAATASGSPCRCRCPRDTRTSGSRSARTAARSSASASSASRAASCLTALGADRRRPAARWTQAAPGWRADRRGAATATGAGGRRRRRVPPAIADRAAMPCRLDFAARAPAAADQLAGLHVATRRRDRAAEWEQLNDGAEQALLTWTACGGDLMLVDGDLDALLPRQQLPSCIGGAAQRHFFGRIHAVTSDHVTRRVSPARSSTADTAQRRQLGAAGQQRAPTGRHRRARLPAADSRRRWRSCPGLPPDPAPVSVLIGPVNYLCSGAVSRRCSC